MIKIFIKGYDSEVIGSRRILTEFVLVFPFVWHSLEVPFLLMNDIYVRSKTIRLYHRLVALSLSAWELGEYGSLLV